MTSRRSLLAGAIALLPLASLGGCAVSFATIKRYVATIGAFVDKVGPVVARLAPSETAVIAKITAQVDAACAAFAQLNAPPSGSSIAETILTGVNDLITVVEALPVLPPAVAAILPEVQLLIVTVAAFFNLTPATIRLRPRAGAALVGMSDSERQTRVSTADARVRAWLASP